MKGLDTPVLLAILHDEPYAKDLLRTLRGEELATTEVNLLELEGLAAQSSRLNKAVRRTILANLRHRLTVFPIAESSKHEATWDARRSSLVENMIWGTMEAQGCPEWITTPGFAPRAPRSFKVRLVGL
jgi:predicted nucleic acid-binding protein